MPDNACAMYAHCCLLLEASPATMIAVGLQGCNRDLSGSRTRLVLTENLHPSMLTSAMTVPLSIPQSALLTDFQYGCLRSKPLSPGVIVKFKPDSWGRLAIKTRIRISAKEKPATL